ncbi:MAG: hypothetical protein H0T73_00630 [Ardenticatenales bacterium]|nr:hypothetical protein [Ardenticatenales bacterium]
MDFEKIYLVSANLEVASADDVKRLEEHLGVDMPVGYANYVMRLGRGTYCDYLRVHLPEQILYEYRIVQERLKQHYFWEDIDSIDKSQ